MAAWYGVRSNLAGSAVEIDQRYLSAEPEEVALAMRDFLNITDLDTKRLAQALRNDRLERSSALIDQPVGLESMQRARGNAGVQIDLPEMDGRVRL